MNGVWGQPDDCNVSFQVEIPTVRHVFVGILSLMFGDGSVGEFGIQEGQT
jgi:hypothetical protein